MNEKTGLVFEPAKVRQSVFGQRNDRGGNLLIGHVLEGAWRPDPPLLCLSEQALACVGPLLIGSGAAALGWARISQSKLARSEHALPLRNTALRCAIHSGLRDAALERIVDILNGVGVRPLIFKGWSAARFYKSARLRPYGDFDLIVRSQDQAIAGEALTRQSLPNSSDPKAGRYSFAANGAPFGSAVDMHATLPPYYMTPPEALFDRARRTTLSGGQILLEPCPEDHLRLVTLHFFKHGGWRPLWLCDIAAMVEAAGPNFDWDLCLTKHRKTRGWMDAGLSAAHELLGCHVGHVPKQMKPTPRWVIATILKEWQAPFAKRFRAPESNATARYFAAKLASYWLNPISSALLRGAGVSSIRPIHQQIAYAAVSIGTAFLKPLTQG